MTKVIICGYGMERDKLMEKYVWHALETASETRAWAIIPSGGNTGKANGQWETEAEMMGAIAEEIISLTGKPIEILLEKNAYNTLGNLENSEQMMAGEHIVIVCNKAHLPKVFFAAIKVFGLRSVIEWRISFRPFPLTTGKIENLMILAKTGPEVVGYFFRPLGRRIEYEQWKRRTGRDEQLTYKEFCSKFRNTGELI